MKNKFLIFVVLLFMVGFSGTAIAQTEDELVEICGLIAKEATFLKDFKVRLDAGDPPPIQRFSVILKKDIKYRFSVCNSKDFDGKVILELFDNNRLQATTYVLATGKDFPSVDFTCQKTGAYHLSFKFKDGKQGLAVGLLSLVEAL
ncbi:MAG: hypothetical protein AB9846_04280 [Tenuifilaceae bacterium]